MSFQFPPEDYFTNMTFVEGDEGIHRPSGSEGVFLDTTINVVRVAVAIVGLLSNGVLFFVFAHFPVFNIPSNHFIFSLAINDVLSLICDLFFIFVHFAKPNFAQAIPCILSNVGIVFVTINMTQLAAIALERYLFIRKPLHYYQLITKWKNIIITASWILPTFLFTPLIQVLQCEQIGPMPLFMILFAGYLLTGFVFIACLYFLVFRTASSQMKAMIMTYPNVDQSNELSHNVKLLRGYFLIVGSTFITYFLPISIFCAYIASPSLLPTLMKIKHFAGVLATVNNSINPFVYFYCQKTFKDCVTKIVRKLKNQANPCTGTNLSNHTSYRESFKLMDVA